MGRHRRRLIVQADITSEEDQAFVAWVLERRRKRRLAEEIRQGLQLQYRRHTNRARLPEAPAPEPEPIPEVVVSETNTGATGSSASKLARLVGGF